MLRGFHFSECFVFQNKQGPPPHPYVPRSASGRPGGKPPTSRGCVKRTKSKGKKGKKGCRDTYDLIVNIDLVSFINCVYIQTLLNWTHYLEYFVNPSKEFVRCEIFWKMKAGVGGGAPSQAREPEYHLGLKRTVNKIFQDDRSI